MNAPPAGDPPPRSSTRWILAVFSFFIPGSGIAYLPKRSVLHALIVAFAYAAAGVVSALAGASEPTMAQGIAGALGRLISAVDTFRVTGMAGGPKGPWWRFLVAVAVWLGLLFSLPQALKPWWSLRQVPGIAMEPTILFGDRVWVRKVWAKPQAGELVVFYSPLVYKSVPLDRQEVYLKRVVALPNDLVEIRAKQLFVNGRRHDEPYAVFRDTMTFPPPAAPRDAAFQDKWQRGIWAKAGRGDVGDYFGPVKVPEGTYFVLGDNRDQSLDSRFLGPVPQDAIVGKVTAIASPRYRARRFK